MKLTVLQPLRLVPGDPDMEQFKNDEEPGTYNVPPIMLGAIYIADHVIEPNKSEAGWLLQNFPDRFEAVAE